MLLEVFYLELNGPFLGLYFPKPDLGFIDW